MDNLENIIKHKKATFTKSVTEISQKGKEIRERLFNKNISKSGKYTVPFLKIKLICLAEYSYLKQIGKKIDTISKGSIKLNFTNGSYLHKTFKTKANCENSFKNLYNDSHVKISIDTKNNVLNYEITHKYISDTFHKSIGFTLVSFSDLDTKSIDAMILTVLTASQRGGDFNHKEGVLLSFIGKDYRVYGNKRKNYRTHLRRVLNKVKSITKIVRNGFQYTINTVESVVIKAVEVIANIQETPIYMSKEEALNAFRKMKSLYQ